jgi:hypothetical protein
MYKKGRPKIPCNFNLEQYVERMIITMRPIIKKKLALTKSSFINTRELDDLLCNDMKEDSTLIDGKRRWIEIHRSIRMRIIATTLVEKLGYKMWSGKSRKVLCKPEREFKRASELK